METLESLITVVFSIGFKELVAFLVKVSGISLKFVSQSIESGLL